MTRDLLALTALTLAFLGILCCGLAFVYWFLQWAYGVLHNWRQSFRSWRVRRMLRALARETVSEHWLKHESWK